MALKATLFTILTLMCLSSGAQTGVLFGTVTDENGDPIKTAYVSVVDHSRRTPANRRGEYSAELPANKEFLIEIGALNFHPKLFSITLSDGEERRLDVELALKASDSVVIRAKYLDLEDVDPPPTGRIPSPTDNFEDFLKVAMLGVSSSNELSSTYNVRGGNYDENLIYVNDIEIYRPFLVRSGQQEGLSFIHSDLIQDIQFSAGGFDAKYGDKLSSVLDIRYRDPVETKASIRASLMGAHLHFEGVKNRFSYLVGGRYRNNSYLLSALQTQGDYRPVFADAQALLGWQQSEFLRIEFLGHYSNNKYRVVPENRETAFGPINEALKFTVFFDGQEITQFQTLTGALSFNYKVSQNTDLKLITSAFRSYETEKFDIQGQYWLDDLETDLGSEDFGETTFNRGVGTFLNHARNELQVTIANAYLKGDSRIARRHRLFYGAKYQHEIFDDKLSEWQMIDSAGFSIPQGPSNEIALNDVLKAQLGIESNRYSGYVQDVYTISKPKQVRVIDTVSNVDSTFNSYAFWRVAGGVRAQYWDYNGQFVVSPRAKVTYKPRWYYTRGDSVVRRDAEIRFATGVYNQPPLYRALRTLDGSLNNAVVAQRSIHFVLGGHTTFDMWDRPFKFVAEAYYKKLDFLNPYEIDNVRLRYHAHNNAKGYATGVDVKINGEFVKGIESWAKLSFLKTEEDILDDYFNQYFNSDGEEIIFGFTLNDSIVDSVRNEPGNIPRPADQRITFGLFFQDQMPKWPSYKVQLTILFGTALPYGPPDHDRWKDVLRTPAYRRVDIGFSKDLLVNRERLKKDSWWHNVDDMWISLEVFNLLNINNTISYTWIKDVNNLQYPVPNFLTSRRINLKFVAKF